MKKLHAGKQTKNAVLGQGEGLGVSTETLLESEGYGLGARRTQDRRPIHVCPGEGWGLVSR